MSNKKFTKSEINSNPAVQQATKAKAKVANELSELKAERDQLTEEIDEMTKQAKNIRVGAALNEVSDDNIDDLEQKLDKAKQRLKKLEPEIVAREEALSELRERVKKARQKSINELKPRARSARDRKLKKVIEALGKVVEANQEMEAFENSIHPSLNVTAKSLNLRRCEVAQKAPAGVTQEIERFIKNHQ